MGLYTLVKLVGSGSGAGAVANQSRVTINAEIDYKNIVKLFGFDQDPTVMNNDGYPQSAPALNLLARTSPSMPSGYYGNFVLSWTGTASIAWVSAPPLIVISGGTSVGFGFSSGDSGPGNQTFAGTTPSVTFAVGWNIQSISSGTAGVIRINTKTNYVASGSGFTIHGNQVNISGAATNTGANGTWTVINLTASSFELSGSTFTNSGAVQGIVLFASDNNSINMPSSGTYSGFSNLVWCRAADVTSIAAGQQVSDDLIAQFQYLGNATEPSLSSRMWLRFMGPSGVQTNWERDFAQRKPVTAMCYSDFYPQGYWVGTITNTADVFTCSNPSASGGGAYVDGEFVMGKISGANTTGTPTLNVNSRGAKPIFYETTNGWPLQIKFSGPPASAGLTMQFTFSATWLNGGTPYVFTYTTVSGDTGSIGALVGNLAAAMALDATLIAGKVLLGNNQFGGSGPGVPLFPRTAQAGRLSVSYTSGPAIVSGFQTIDITGIVNGNLGTFIYNYLLDGFMYWPTPPTFSVPLEIIVEMCNRIGANCWYNFGFTSSAYITSSVQFFGDAVTGLTSGLKFGWEPWNEVWNFSAEPSGLLSTLGICLGFSNLSDDYIYSYTGLRVRQQAPISLAAWTGKGRVALDHYILCPTQLGEATNGNFDNFQCKGTSLSASNTIYSTYGGLNGGVAADYTAAGSRPLDFMDTFGCAPYINSRWWGTGSFTFAGEVTGTAAANSPWLQAALDYKNGLTTTAFASLVNQFTRVTDRGISNGATDFVDMQGFFNQQEAMAAQYDTFRVSQGQRKIKITHYEGGMAFGIGSDGNNGVNSVNSGDIAALAAQMTSLGWNVSPWTFSGTDDKTEMATMTFTMSQAWKFDASYKNMIKTWYYQALKSTNTAREAHGAQFGYQANNWCLWPINFRTSPSYTSYDAIHEFNQ